MNLPAWLRPNGRTTRSTAAFLASAQVTFLIALWWSNPPQLLPGPVEVLGSLRSMLRDGLLYELGVSLAANLEALVLVSVLSLTLSYATVIPAARPAASAVAACRNFGISGFVVIFAVLFGSGHSLRVALLAFCMAPFFVTSMASIVASIPREEWDDARILRMGPWRSTWEVVVLGRLDQALEVLRQNAAMGWMVLTMVEGLTRTEGGLGVLMLNENKHFDLSAVFAIQAVIFAVGVLQDWLIGRLRVALCPYADLSLERRP